MDKFLLQVSWLGVGYEIIKDSDGQNLFLCEFVT